MFGVNNIICGDCAIIMSTWPDECIDLTVTSPPYDNLRTYNGYTFDFDAIAQQLFRITKQGGVVVWVVADQTVNGSETGTSFKQALYFKEIGFNLHDTMIYEKANPVPLTHNRYEQSFEYMFVMSKNKPKTFTPILENTLSHNTKLSKKSEKHYEDSHAMRKRNETYVVKGTKIKKNVWRYVVGAGQERTTHNAPFTERLAHDHIISWSNEHDTVLDPTCGSGTTLVAAIKTNRNFIGIDISQEYCELTKTRVNKLLAQNTLNFGDNIEYQPIGAIL